MPTKEVMTTHVMIGDLLVHVVGTREDVVKKWKDAMLGLTIGDVPGFVDFEVVTQTHSPTGMFTVGVIEPFTMRARSITGVGREHLSQVADPDDPVGAAPTKASDENGMVVSI